MFEQLGITVAQFEIFLLVTARVSIIIAILPIFSSGNINPAWKFFLSLFIALICTPLIATPNNLPVSFMILLALAMKEVIVGLAIGLAAKVLFEILQFSGFMVGRGMGLAMMTMVDPTTDEQVNVIGQVMNFVAILLLFTIDGHHFFLRAIFDSFHLIPLTEAVFTHELFSQFILMLSDIFIVGFRIGAPLIVLLFVQKVILAFLSRISPQMNVFFLGLPLGILMGFYMLSMYWPFFSYTFLNYFEVYQDKLLSFIQLFSP